MVRTFLQMAAGAADIPVTRLLGQSPAGMSATGSSDTRNYYDMISSSQELDLRPQLERLDALLLRSAGVDPEALSFSFRPLWQLTGAEQAAVALSKAQTTQIYAGLNLWPLAVTSALVQGQLLEDGTYPGAAMAFGDGAAASDPAPMSPEWAQRRVADFDPNQARDPDGRWTVGGGGGGSLAASPRPGESTRAEAGEGHTQNGHIAVSEPARTGDPPSPDHDGPHAPDGTKIELASLRGKGRSGVVAALLGAAVRLARWLGRGAETEEPEPSEAPTPSTEPDVQPVAQSRPQRSKSKFTPQQTAGLQKLFKGGGLGGTVEGAQRLLNQLDEGAVILPQDVTPEVLEKYAQIAQDAISEGIDKRGVQALRLKAIKRILGR